MPERAPIDPVDLVRAYRAEVPGPDARAVARAKRRVLDEVARVARHGSPSPRRRRHRILAGVLVPAALLAAGAGYALREPTKAAIGVACANEATTSPSDTAIIGPDGSDPVAACAELWREGVLGGRPRSAAPPLVACVADTGAIYVMPSADQGICSQLGWHELPAADRERAQRIGAARAALDARMTPGDGRTRNDDWTCMDFNQARRFVRGVLDEHGLGSWSIASRPAQSFSADRPCAGVSFDEQRQVVTLLATPN